MKKIPAKYLKIGGVALATGVVGFVLIKLLKKVTKTSTKTRIIKENKRVKNNYVNVGTDGFVNVRTSPMVDNKLWYKADFSDNLLGKVTSSPIGKILKRVRGKEGYYWYQIQLEKQISGQSTGYVREDVVEIEK